MSEDENDTGRAAKVDELIQEAALKWSQESPYDFDYQQIEFALSHNLKVDLDAVSEEDAERAMEAFENEDDDELVDVLKEYSDDPEAVEQFREENLGGGEGDDEDETSDDVATVDPDAGDSAGEQYQPPDDVDNPEVHRLRKQVAELKSQMNEITDAIQSAGKQPAPQQQQQQGGGGGGMDPNTQAILNAAKMYLESQSEPSPWAGMMEEMQQEMMKSTLKQVQAQAGMTPGQKVGQAVDSEIGEAIAESIEINLGGAKVSPGKDSDGDNSGDSDGGDE